MRDVLRIAAYVLGVVAVVLLSGTISANLAIFFMGNTEGAFFFFFMGCFISGVGASAAFVWFKRTHSRKTETVP